MSRQTSDLKIVDQLQLANAGQLSAQLNALDFAMKLAENLVRQAELDSRAILMSKRAELKHNLITEAFVADALRVIEIQEQQKDSAKFDAQRDKLHLTENVKSESKRADTATQHVSQSIFSKKADAVVASKPSQQKWISKGKAEKSSLWAAAKPNIEAGNNQEQSTTPSISKT